MFYFTWISLYRLLHKHSVSDSKLLKQIFTKYDCVPSKRFISKETLFTAITEFLELNSDEEVLRYTGDKQFESIEDANNFFKN